MLNDCITKLHEDIQKLNIIYDKRILLRIHVYELLKPFGIDKDKLEFKINIIENMEVMIEYIVVEQKDYSLRWWDWFIKTEYCREKWKQYVK